MASLEHIPMEELYMQDGAPEGALELQSSEPPTAESLALTPEARAELDEAFGNIVTELEKTVSVSERAESAKVMNDKVSGSHEPGIKKPE